MGIPAIDITGNLSVSSAVLTDKYTYTARPNGITILSQISVGVDSTFASSGEIIIKVGNENVTSQGVQDDSIPIPEAFNIDLSKGDDPERWTILQPGETINIKAAMSSGSGNIRVIVVGDFLSFVQWQRLLEKKGVKNG
jgi:hypothetical protein